MKILFLLTPQTFFLMEIDVDFKQIQLLFEEFKKDNIGKDYSRSDWGNFLTDREIGFYFIFPESDQYINFK